MTLAPGTPLKHTTAFGDTLVCVILEAGRFWLGGWFSGYEVEFSDGARHIIAHERIGKDFTVATRGNCDPLRRELYGLIHGHAKTLGLSDAAYRMTLRALTGKSSCKDLTMGELRVASSFLADEVGELKVAA